jgi:hypothetical protein
MLGLLETERTCPETHRLQAFEAERSGFSCDMCGSACAAGARLFGCRQCDYDLCEECATTPRLKGDNEQLGALTLARVSELYAQLAGLGASGDVVGLKRIEQESIRSCGRAQHMARTCANMAELVEIDRKFRAGDAAAAAGRCASWLAEVHSLGWLGYRMAEGFI